MRLSGENTKKLCGARSLSLNALLKRAGVSKTAYYHLIDKESVLPRSVDALAAALGVQPSALLEESDRKSRRALRLLEAADRIAGSDPSMDRDNIRHTLLLLEEKPIDRLQRSLLRARKSDLHE
jgi:transcriptional regulator with XRE-family HTH domain